MTNLSDRFYNEKEIKYPFRAILVTLISYSATGETNPILKNIQTRLIIRHSRLCKRSNAKLLLLQSKAKESLTAHISKNLKHRKIKITVKEQHCKKSVEQL